MPNAATGGGTPWGAISQGVGLGLDVLGSAAAARKKNGILAEGARQQNRAGMEATGISADFINQLRQSRPNPGAERGAFSAALGAPAVSGVPGASAAFRGDAASATRGAQGYGRQLADLFARIRAPAQQRRGEAESMVEMGNALRPIQAQAQDAEFLTSLRAGMTQQNPWLSTLAGGLQQGGAYATKQGY